MAGKDPPEHEIGTLPSKLHRRQLYGRRNGGDPVEAIEDCKERQAIGRELGEGQIEQRETAQAVITTGPTADTGPLAAAPARYARSLFLLSCRTCRRRLRLIKEKGG
jgi:hypothetical protein